MRLYIRGFLTHKVGGIRGQLSIPKAASPLFIGALCLPLWEDTRVRSAFVRELNSFPLVASMSRS